MRAAIPPERVITAELDIPRVSLSIFPQDVQLEGSMQAYDRALLAAVGPRYKLIRSSTGNDELYDLREDPGELHPLARAEVETAGLAELEAALERLLAETPAPLGVKAEGQLDPDEQDALRALGYAGESEDSELRALQAPPRPRKPR